MKKKWVVQQYGIFGWSDISVYHSKKAAQIAKKKKTGLWDPRQRVVKKVPTSSAFR